MQINLESMLAHMFKVVVKKVSNTLKNDFQLRYKNHDPKSFIMVNILCILFSLPVCQ